MNIGLAMRSRAGVVALVSYALFTSVFFVIIYVYLMRHYIASPPFYDEIWKLDVVTSASPLQRSASYGVLPLAWAYLMKLLLWLLPEQLYVSRALAAMWIVPAIILTPFCFMRVEQTGHRNLVFVSGAVFIGLANPVQSVLTYFNPYVFEVCYSVLLLVFCARWGQLNPMGKGGCLALLAATAFCGLSPLFYLPALYLMLLLRAVGWRWQVGIGCSALISLGLAIGLILGYNGPKTTNMAYLRSFWGPEIVQGSPAQLLKAVEAFPNKLAGSLLPMRLVPVSAHADDHGVTWLLGGLVLLGVLTMWRTDKPMTCCVLSASAVACVLAFLTPWPLTFATPLNRVNLAWLWPWYFAFGIGVARAMESLFSSLGRGTNVALIAALVAVSPMLTPYTAPDDPDREMFTDIADIVHPTEPGLNMIFPAHYSTVPYANYLLANRWPDRFFVIPIDPQTPAATYLEGIPIHLAAREEVRAAWIIVPHFMFKDPIMRELEVMSLPGFRLAKVTETRNSRIWKYARLP